MADLTTFMCRLSWNLGASVSWNLQGLSRSVMGLLYLYLYLSSCKWNISLRYKFQNIILKTRICAGIGTVWWQHTKLFSVTFSFFFLFICRHICFTIFVSKQKFWNISIYRSLHCHRQAVQHDNSSKLYFPIIG